MSSRFWAARWFAAKAPATRTAPGASAAAESVKASRSELDPKIKDVVFVHIPKAAGTSMRHMLSASMPAATKIFEYGADTATLIAVQRATVDDPNRTPDAGTTSGDIIDAFASGLATPEQIAALRAEAPRGQRFLVSSQKPIRHWSGAFHPASVVTFLRDPVDRLVSSYRMHVRQKRFAGSFAEFYESRDQINVQSRQLSGLNLRDLGFVGLFELMPTMLEALSRHLGAELRMRHDNPAGGSPRLTIDEASRSRILALNDDDLCLYRYVEANLDYFTNYRGRAPDINSKLARGKVYRKADGKLTGWALTHDHNRLATVEVRVGGQPILRSYADQFVPWLKKVTPHGVGGFQIRLPEGVTAGKEPIRVMIAGTTKDLEGSPLSP